ncbi:MAG: Ig-like domain-containing protein, partial [Oscillospiraceae bacterium]|nr:Ig-like domain-containing protein [Oscillospiraceae bacterium]
MKRLLATIITLAMVLSLVPAAFAADLEAKTYTLNNTVGNIGLAATENTLFLSEVDEYGTWGWKHFGYDRTITETKSPFFGYISNSSNGLMFYHANATVKELIFALSLQTPAGAGFYVPKTQVNPQSGSTTLNMYADKKSDTLTMQAFSETDAKLIMSKSDMPAQSLPYTADKAVYTQNGDDIVVAYKTENKNYKFFSITLEPINNATLTITADKAELDTADNKTATISATVKETGSETSVAVANNFITYHSDNTAVATVSADGTITAVGEGTAKITAQSPDSKVKSNEIEVTVTVPAEPEEDEELTKAFAHESTTTVQVSNNVTVNTYVYTVDGTKKELDETTTVPVGTAYEVNADEITGMDGYEFLYWAKGATMKQKQIVSGVAKYSFIPTVEATHLIAVFAPTTAEGEAKAEFYNGNGQLL